MANRILYVELNDDEEDDEFEYDSHTTQDEEPDCDTDQYNGVDSSDIDDTGMHFFFLVIEHPK